MYSGSMIVLSLVTMSMPATHWPPPRTPRARPEHSLSPSWPRPLGGGRSSGPAPAAGRRCLPAAVCANTCPVSRVRSSPLPWKRLYLKVWVHYFHKSHILNELQLIQNMMLVNSKLPKTFEIITQMSDSVFFPMVPPLHIGWKTDGRLIESGVSFYPILLYFTM